MDDLQGMTQERWTRLTPHQRDAIRDNSGLTKQLNGLEGWRVEVVNSGDTRKRRFIVGKSTGWRPCHLEILTTRSMGGFPAATSYQSVRPIKKIR